jgi:DNA-binding NtrC family response regulator
MADGSLVVLDRADRAAEYLVAELATRWDVTICPSVTELANLLEFSPATVGLVRADSADVRFRDLESLLLANPVTQWIALVEPVHLEDSALRGLVARACADYMTLPPDVRRLTFAVGHAAGMARLRQTVSECVAEPRTSDLLGTSLSMRRLMRALARVSAVDAPVLVHGETGTGKELVAREIHALCPRAGGPFIAVNCGALPPSLIHSELFGHERGAFTGAASRRVGRIEAASGGTVFLDEIGDLPQDLQAHLLRFLEESTIERLGNGAPIHVDTRVIAATHVDLEQAVAAGRFREDLYYRLNVLRIDTPPLRERREDIELLARDYFHRFRTERAPGVRGFSQEAIEAMLRHDWPGNVRELINRVRRAMVMCEHRAIRPEDLGLERRQRPRYPVTLDVARQVAEREAIVGSLRQCQNNITRAAEQLGVARMTLYRLMDRHGLRAGASAEAVD